jgi:hypothetical protein
LAEAERRGDALYLDLELPSAQRQLDDAEAFLLAHRKRLVILDEVQRLPELFAVLRGVIDQRRRAGERPPASSCCWARLPACCCSRPAKVSRAASRSSNSAPSRRAK